MRMLRLISILLAMVVCFYTTVVSGQTNRAPVANAGPDRTVAEGELVILDGTGSYDPEGEDLSFEWYVRLNVRLYDANSATPSFTAPQVADARFNRFHFYLTVTDARGTRSRYRNEVVITVTAGPNDAPRAHAGPDRRVGEGATVTLDGSGSSDPEREKLSFAWSAPNGVTLDDASSATPRFTAPVNLAADRTLPFSLVVTDARGLESAPATLVITVTANNAGPTAHAGPDQTVAEGRLVTLDGRASSDPEGETLTYQWFLERGPFVALTGSATATPRFTAPVQLVADIEWVFTLVVSDARGNVSAPATVTIRVTANNVRRADAGPDQTVTEGARVTLDGTGSFAPEGEALGYRWRLRGGGQGYPLRLDDDESATPSFTVPDKKDLKLVFTLQVYIRGRLGSFSHDEVTITVTAGSNDTPTANAGDDATVAEGARVTLDGADSSDPEGEDLGFEWSAPNGVTLDDASSATPGFTAPEQLAADRELVFSLVVRDARGRTSAPATVVITVTAGANDAPTAHAGPDQRVGEGATVMLDGAASSDPEGEALSFAWSAPNGVTLDDTSSATPRFTAPVNLAADRTLAFSLVVTDTRGLESAPATVVITVTANNTAPNAHAGADQTVDEAEVVTLDGTGSYDPEGEGLSFEWIAPYAVTLDDASSATPRFTTPEQLLADLELAFTLEVRDARGAVSAPATVVITVMAGQDDRAIVDAGPDQTVAEGELVMLDGTGSYDPEGAVLFYSWDQENGPFVELDDRHSATPSFTAPTELAADRELVFRFYINMVIGPIVRITVTAGSNDAPTAHAGPDQRVGEGALVTLDGSGSSDPEGEALSFAWSAPNGVTLDDASSATPSFTAPVNLAIDRTLPFSLVVRDASGRASTPATLMITVTANNAGPTAHAGPDQTVAGGAVVTLDGRASSDPEGETLTYQWSLERGPFVALTGSASATPRFTPPDNLEGDIELVFTLVVRDTRSSSASDSVTIRVTTNNALRAGAGSDQVVAEGARVTLDGTGSSDPEGEALSFVWSAPNGVTLDDASSATPSFTAPEQLAADRELVFSLVVRDARGRASAPDTVVITVTANNAAGPRAHVGGKQTVDEAEVVTLDGTGSSDPEGEDLSFAWSGPDNVVLTAADTATPRFTAPEQLLADLELEFTLEVRDASGNVSAPATVVITVTAGPNDRPIADAGPDRIVAVGELVMLDGTGSYDPEGGELRYRWDFVLGDGILLLNSNRRGDVTATPSFTALIRYVEYPLYFALQVTDASGNVSLFDVVTITVTAASNDPPTANAGDDATVAEGARVTLDGTGSSDPEGEDLSFEWTAPNEVTLSDATSVTPSFTAPEELLDDRELEFSLVVRDASGTASAPDTVTITVKAGSNDAPTANAGPDQTVVEGALVMLDATGSSDPGGGDLSFEWTAPTGVTLSDATSATPSFTAPEELVDDRELEFSLEVRDASGTASAPATVTITVMAGANDAPIANAGPDQTVAEGDEVTLDGTGSADPEGEELSFAWTAPNAVPLTAADTVTPSFTAPEQLAADRELVFTLEVRDANGTASAPATVTITVKAGENDAPTAIVDTSMLDPELTIAEGEVVTLSGAGSSDPEGEDLSFAWTGPDDVPLTDADTMTPSFTAPLQLAGDRKLVFALVVSDANGNASEETTVTMTVMAGPNDPPIADAGPDRDVKEGSTVTLDATGSSDPEGEDLSFAWTAPTDVTLDDASLATPSFIAPDNLENDLELEFSLMVTDARNLASAPATVTITVKAGPDLEIIVEPSELTIQEGATGRYTVQLNADPEGEVTVVPDSDNDDVTLSPARLVFNTGNWGEPQMVTVTAAKDSGGAMITHTFNDDDNVTLVKAGSVTVTVRELDPIIAPISDFMLNRANALVENQPGLVHFLKQGAVADSSPGFKLTQATQGKFGFDGSLGDNGIWGSLGGAWSESDTSKSRHVFGALGKHKWYSDRRLVGMMLQFDMADEELANRRGEIDGTGWLAGPYFAARHSTQPLYFEGRLLWGQSYNHINFDDPAPNLGLRRSDFDSTRWLAQLRMEGEMSLGTSRLLPYVDASWTEDRSRGFTDGLGIRVPGLTVRLGQLRLGSNIEIPVALKQGKMTITGGLGVTPSYTDNNSPDPALSQTRARADFGIDYKLNKNTYLNFDSHYDGIGVSDYKSFGLSFSAEFKF